MDILYPPPRGIRVSKSPRGIGLIVDTHAAMTCSKIVIFILPEVGGGVATTIYTSIVDPRAAILFSKIVILPGVGGGRALF